MIDYLLYRRQFVLARQEITEISHWQKFNLNQYVIQAHPDLQLEMVNDSSRTLILLGYLYDANNYTAGNHSIIQKLFNENQDFSSLILSLKPYAGRYAIIYKDDVCFNIVQDALALREVYYTEVDNKVICASQPNLLVRFSEPTILKSSGPELIEFVNDHLPSIRNGRLWPGDGTVYDNVKHLLPNHYFDILKLRSRRYWPNTPIQDLELNAAVEKAASFLQGTLQAAAHRQPLMMAVTAGYDSRALLAASKPICQSVHYFINKHDHLADHSNDISIPRQIFKKIKIPFHIHTYSKEVPSDFKKTFLNNTFFSHEQLLPVIYNVYHKSHSDKLNILGVGEVGRTKFFDPPNNLDAYYLSYMLKHRKSSYAVKECEKWLSNSAPIADRYKINIMTLFWWEVLIGNWGAVGNSESDIAIEEFDPYDSHYLYETFLAIHPKYRKFYNNVLFKKLILYMWPELLELPVNPPENLKDLSLSILQKLGIEKKLRNMKYKHYKKKYSESLMQDIVLDCKRHS